MDFVFSEMFDVDFWVWQVGQNVYFYVYLLCGGVYVGGVFGLVGWVVVIEVEVDYVYVGVEEIFQYVWWVGCWFEGGKDFGVVLMFNYGKWVFGKGLKLVYFLCFMNMFIVLLQLVLFDVLQIVQDDRVDILLCQQDVNV